MEQPAIQELTYSLPITETGCNTIVKALTYMADHDPDTSFTDVYDLVRGIQDNTIAQARAWKEQEEAKLQEEAEVRKLAKLPRSANGRKKK